MERSDELLYSWFARRIAPLLRWALAHQLITDSLTAVLLGAVSLAGLASQHRLTVLSASFCVGLCAPLLLHKRGPWLVFAVIAVVALMQWLTSVPSLADAMLLVALGWIAFEQDIVRTTAAAAVLEVGVVAASLKWATEDPIKVLVGLSGMAFAAMVLGVVARQRGALVVSMTERAARLEVERDQEGRLAAAAERARIAREMHDIVSHNLTVMIALADGARYAIDDPERATAAIERVSATGRQALAEMRRLLGVLHDDSASTTFEPQPRLERLDELISQIEAAGIPVAVSIDGELGTLSDGVQLTVFRVVQESLTNILKHASLPASAEVFIGCTDGGVEVEVSDVGAGTPAAVVTSSAVRASEGGNGSVSGAKTGAGTGPGGRGITGMRERALAYGGSLNAGPLGEHGWRVRMIIADAATHQQ